MNYIKLILVIAFAFNFLTCSKRDVKINDIIIKQSGDQTIYSYEKGRLLYNNGVPILYLSGNNYEMGYQYGILLKDDIRKIVKNITEIKKIYISQQPFYYRLFSNNYINHKLNKISSRLPEKYIEELKGISDGSGVDIKDLLFINISGNIIQGRCASIISSDNGNIIHGRNFDLIPHFLSDYFVIVNYNGENQNSYTNFGIISYIGCFQGMNNKGISISLNYGEGAYNKKYNGIPIGFKIREILEINCNLDEVNNYIKENKNDEPGSILSICSFNENSGRIYDLYEKEKVFTEYNIEKNKPLYEFNAIFNNRRLDDNYTLSKKYLSFDVGQYGNNTSREYHAEKIILENNDNYNKNFLFDFLQNTDFYNYKHFIGSGNYLTISNEFTLFSLIFDYNNRSVYFSKGNSYAGNGKIYKYNIDNQDILTFRDEDMLYLSEEISIFNTWFAKYQIASLKNQKKELKTLFNSDDKEIFPQKIVASYVFYINNKKYIDKTTVLYYLNKGIELFPNYYLFHSLKGGFFNKDKDYKKAIEEYEKALNCEIIFEFSKTSLYYRLFEVCKKSHLDEKRDYYKEKFIESYNENRLKYKIPKYMEKKYKEINTVNLK